MKTIPGEWKKTITISVFKKGNKKPPENYRGITLLNIPTKLFTKILETMLIEHVTVSEKQQGFRKSRSTIDAIFIVRQIVEYDKPAFKKE